MNYDSRSMKKVATEAAVRAGKPGSFSIEEVTEGEETYKRMWVHLPDGSVGAFNLEPAPAHLPFAWPWSGSDKKPTIKRPIRLPERWCGQIKAGRMISDPAIVASPQQTVPALPPPVPGSTIIRRP